jgi:hypothetical protein
VLQAGFMSCLLPLLGLQLRPCIDQEILLPRFSGVYTRHVCFGASCVYSYIVGQADAKRAVAIALRNRWRRHQLPQELRSEVCILYRHVIEKQTDRQGGQAREKGRAGGRKGWIEEE